MVTWDRRRWSSIRRRRTRWPGARAFWLPAATSASSCTTSRVRARATAITHHAAQGACCSTLRMPRTRMSATTRWPSPARPASHSSSAPLASPALRAFASLCHCSKASCVQLQRAPRQLGGGGTEDCERRGIFGAGSHACRSRTCTRSRHWPGRRTGRSWWWFGAVIYVVVDA